MKLSELETRDAHEAGTPVTIRGVDGEETDFVIYVRGQDSITYRQYLDDVRRKSLEAKADGSEYERPGTEELLAAITIGWEGLEGDDGKPVEFSRETAKQLYEAAPYIADQVDRVVHNRAVFIRG